MSRPCASSAIPGDDDGGFTLLEVTIGMVILTIFLGIFGGAMVSMFRSVSRTQQTSYAESAVNIAYDKLEREIPYASGISVPGTDSSGSPVVEFTTDYGVGSQTCTELRLTSTGSFIQRTWTVPQGTATPTPGSTVVLGTDLTSTVGSNPFSRIDAGASSTNQQLQVKLTARDASQVTGSNTRSRNVDLTIAAVNTGTATASDQACAAGRTIAWTTG